MLKGGGDQIPEGGCKFLYNVLSARRNPNVLPTAFKSIFLAQSLSPSSSYIMATKNEKKVTENDKILQQITKEMTKGDGC